MVEWLIGDIDDDVRFRLARILSDETFADYDVVMMDAPPRMSLGAINALASSHAVIVPTVLDELSASAITPLVSRLNTARSMNPTLHYLGAVGTLRGQRGGADVRDQTRDAIEARLEKWTGTNYLFEHDIKYFTALARVAGTDIGFITDPDVRKAYELLGREMIKELRL
ncbi:MAG: ParA family protein, partial [Pseudomonadota bacterium]